MADSPIINPRTGKPFTKEEKRELYYNPSGRKPGFRGRRIKRKTKVIVEKRKRFLKSFLSLLFKKNLFGWIFIIAKILTLFIFKTVPPFKFIWGVFILPSTFLSSLGIPGFVGWIFNLLLMAVYVFYDQRKMFYNPDEGIKIGSMLFTAVSAVASILIFYILRNGTAALFAFVLFMVFYGFYDGADPRHKPKILWTFAIILAIVGGIFGLNKFFIETGRLQSVTEPILDRLGIGDGPIDSLSDIWDLIVNPEKARKFGSIEDTELQKKDIGITVKNLKPVSSTFNPNTPISVRGTVEAASLYSKDSLVKFSCKLEGYDANSGISVNPEETVLPGNAIKMIQTVSCIFEKGVTPRTNLDSRTVNFISSFESFYTESTYNVFFLDDEKFDELYSQGINPFDVYGWDKSLLSPGNLMNSKVTPGPVNLIIGSEIPQPFKEGDADLFFEVIIEPDSQVKNVNVNEFKLYAPSDVMELETDTKFCDFELGESDDINYNVYQIKDKSKLKLKEDQNLFGCFFRVNEFFGVREYRGDVVRAEMTYSFDLIRKTSVTIRRT